MFVSDALSPANERIDPLDEHLVLDYGLRHLVEPLGVEYLIVLPLLTLGHLDARLHLFRCDTVLFLLQHVFILLKLCIGLVVVLFDVFCLFSG